MSDEAAVAWLRLQIEGDRDGARAASGEWDAEHVRCEFEDLPDEVFAHARRHDPQDVIADCEAKLDLLRMFWPLPAYGEMTARQVLGAVASAYRHRQGYAEHWG